MTQSSKFGKHLLIVTNRRYHDIQNKSHNFLTIIFRMLRFVHKMTQGFTQIYTVAETIRTFRMQTTNSRISHIKLNETVKYATGDLQRLEIRRGLYRRSRTCRAARRRKRGCRSSGSAGNSGRTASDSQTRWNWSNRRLQHARGWQLLTNSRRRSRSCRKKPGDF